MDRGLVHIRDTEVDLPHDEQKWREIGERRKTNKVIR
jgi:hypothetical protein